MILQCTVLIFVSPLYQQFCSFEAAASPLSITYKPVSICYGIRSGLSDQSGYTIGSGDDPMLLNHRGSNVVRDHCQNSQYA